MTHFLVTITAVIETMAVDKDEAEEEILWLLSRVKAFRFENPSVRAEKVKA